MGFLKDLMNRKNSRGGQNSKDRETATQAERTYLGTIERAVEYLQECKKNGQNVYVDFNGHRLYSCDVTLDSAYLEIVGETKADFERSRKEWIRKSNEEEKEQEKKAKAKVPEWIRKGKAFIYPERMQDWEECVKSRASDLYHGSDLESALVLMEKLENGASIEEVKKIFDEQNHSGASAGMVRSILLEFSKRGPEFYRNTSFGELSIEEKVLVQQIEKENQEIKQGTYKRFDRRELIEEEITEAKISEWIRKGEAIISPDKWEAWKKHVEARARGMWAGLSIDEEIELMERLRAGESFESLTKIIQEDETRLYIGAVHGVLRFSEFGPDFTEFFEKAIGEYTPEIARAIEEVRAENAKRKETVLDSAIEATEEVTTTSMMKKQAKDVEMASQEVDKNGQEAERDDE